MNKNKIIEIIVIFLVAIFYVAAVPFISGCSVYTIIKESYMAEEEGLELPQIDIDEKEISGIGKVDIEIKKSYDIEEEINLIDDSVRDPFKPFYIKDGEEEEKNMLKLEKIYTMDGIEYAELSLNDYPYLLKEGDTLSDIYLVQAINETSVVLLKGDDIVTVFIDVVVYD
ncbi:MAG: hypothetical protein IMZ51_02760 [Chloroflexi bacterium]|jgi:hypothetical protein|nr:hypothetical protein [Chloroflexota bacterium]